MRYIFLIFCVLSFAPIVATAQTATGEICVVIFEDTNQSGARDSDELPLEGVATTVALPDGVIIRSHISNSLPEPYCFEELVVGDYLITFVDSANHQGTMQNSALLTVSSGGRMSIDYGAIAQDALTAEVTVDDSSELSTTNRLLIAAIGSVLVMMLVGGLGLVIGTLFIR